MTSLIVGAGSIGRRHAGNLRRLLPDQPLLIWRHREQRDDDALAREFDARLVYSLEDALAAEPTFAVIAGPNTTHLSTACPLASAGVHLFIEKPLSVDCTGIDELQMLCRRHRVIAMVGYVFRFYPPLQRLRAALLAGDIGRLLYVRAETGSYLPDWRPGTDYRTSASASRALGGGVVLDLTHELDYTCWLAGAAESVSAVVAHISDLETDTEDIGEMTLRLPGGVVGSVHVDFFQRVTHRTLRVVGTDGTLTWDCGDNSVKLYRAGSDDWQTLCPAHQVDRNQMYLDEMQHFVNCVRSGTAPDVTLEQAASIVALAVAAKQAAEDGREIRL